MTDEVARLREELRRAEESLRRQESFLAVVAHELRNPLGPVLLSIDTLVAEASAGPIAHDTLLRRLHNMQRYAKRLRTDLDRLLDFSRLRSGRIDLQLVETDLSEIAAATLQDMAPLIKAAGCELRTSIDTPQPGRWDPMRLRQIVWNLVSNAIKYAPGAPIEIATSGTASAATLRLADHGPGIPAEERGAIFEQFKRVRPDAPHTGFGVGLWLVRNIVEAMHGTIQLDSEVHVGTTFTITLPRNPQ